MYIFGLLSDRKWLAEMICSQLQLNTSKSDRDVARPPCPSNRSQIGVYNPASFLYISSAQSKALGETLTLSIYICTEPDGYLHIYLAELVLSSYWVTLMNKSHILLL